MELDDRDLVILRYLEDGPRALKPLFDTLSSSVVYARAKRLEAAGYVSRDGAKRGLLPAGREALAAARAPSVPASVEPDLSDAVPHIALAPTPVHRAVMIVAAAKMMPT